MKEIMSMSLDSLEKEYFEWMCNLVIDNNHLTSITFSKLLGYLYQTEFYPIIEKDVNRVKDGIDFRYIFADEAGYSENDIDACLGDKPCGILEMMIALSFRIEENIMEDYTYGNRLGQWFWNMIVSLGLGQMSDGYFDRDYVDRVIDRFLKREYNADGRGGLFTIEGTNLDLRNAEIWYQAMWYLNGFLDW